MGRADDEVLSKAWVLDYSTLPDFTISPNNIQATKETTGWSNSSISSTLSFGSSLHTYWEVSVNHSSSLEIIVGIITHKSITTNTTTTLSDNGGGSVTVKTTNTKSILIPPTGDFFVGSDEYSWGWKLSTGEILHNGKTKKTNIIAQVGDVYGLFYEQNNGLLLLFKVNKFEGPEGNIELIERTFIGALFSGITPLVRRSWGDTGLAYPAISVYNAGDVVFMKCTDTPDDVVKHIQQYYKQSTNISLVGPITPPPLNSSSSNSRGEQGGGPEPNHGCVIS